MASVPSTVAPSTSACRWQCSLRQALAVVTALSVACSVLAWQGALGWLVVAGLAGLALVPVGLRRQAAWLAIFGVWLAFLCAMLYSAGLYVHIAEGTIAAPLRIRVEDARTGQPLVGAMVRLHHGNAPGIHGQTDTAGFVVFHYPLDCLTRESLASTRVWAIVPDSLWLQVAAPRHRPRRLPLVRFTTARCDLERLARSALVVSLDPVPAGKGDSAARARLVQ